MAETREAEAELRSRRTGRRKPPTDMEVNLTALIDVFFMLMLFFLVSSRIAAGEGALAGRTVFPAGRVVGGPIRPAIEVRLRDASAGSAAMTVEGRPTSPEALLADLRSAEPVGRAVRIAADRRVEYSRVLAAVNTARRAGCRDVQWACP